ncbi:MAG: PIN domain-containing protein [Chloroflexi bacterium]|nr:PIN domain-containing protein [Chloroflexota bacterium]
MPQNDMWIAAIALRYDLTLMTKDEHFNEVEGLKVQRW